MSALIDLPLQDWFYDGSSKAQTLNLGSLGGSLQLGDGITPATFPSFVGGGKRGVYTPPSGTNNVGIQHLTCPALGAQGTVYIGIQIPQSSISEVGTRILAIQALAGLDYVSGLMLAKSGSNLVAYWGAAPPVLTASGALTAGAHTICMTNNASLVTLYVDGIVVGTPAAGAGSSTKTGFCFGWVADAYFNAVHASQIYDAKVYSYALTQTQILNLHQRSLARINLY